MTSARKQAGRRRRGLVYAGALALAAALVLVLEARGAAGPAVPHASAPARAARAEFRLTALNGTGFTIPTGKPTILYFMSASCSSCWQGSAQLSQLWPGIRTGADLISLDVAPQVDTAQSVDKMVSTTGALWPQAFATPAILSRYAVRDLDTVVVLTPGGKVVYNGAIPPNQRIRALLRHAGQRPTAPGGTVGS